MASPLDSLLGSLRLAVVLLEYIGTDTEHETTARSLLPDALARARQALERFEEASK